VGSGKTQELHFGSLAAGIVGADLCVCLSAVLAQMRGSHVAPGFIVEVEGPADGSIIP
jgi:hypothetical protein